MKKEQKPINRDQHEPSFQLIQNEIPTLSISKSLHSGDFQIESVQVSASGTDDEEARANFELALKRLEDVK